MPLPNLEAAQVATRRARHRALHALNLSTCLDYMRSVLGDEALDQPDITFSDLLGYLTPDQRNRYDALYAIDMANANDRDTQVTDIPTDSPMPTPTTTNNGTTTVIEDFPMSDAVRIPDAPFTILPTERPEAYEDSIALMDIDVAPGTPAPERDLVESIRSLGVLQTIAVREKTNTSAGSFLSRYEVIEGARRVLAAREVGLTEIPALVFDEDTPRHVISAMTLSANAIRRSNPLRELESIEALVAAGANETTISRELHIPRQTLQARMRLSRLVPELRAAMGDGRIGAAVADLASRLDVNRQNMLVDMLDERAGNSRLMDRRITASDVRELRQARQTSAVNALPDSMFATMPRPIPVPVPRVSVIRDGVIRYEGMTYYSSAEVDAEVQGVRTNRDEIEAELRRTITGLELLRREQETEADIREQNALTFALSEQRNQLNRDFQTRLADAERRAVETARSMFATATAVAGQPVPTVVPTVVAPAPTVAPEAPEVESWSSVQRLLERALAVTPVAPDPRSERVYQTIDELITMTAGMVTQQQASPLATRGPVGPQPLMIRGQYRMFDREPGDSGRYFMRYADTNGRLRRRFMPEAEWNNQRQIAEQRAAAIHAGGVI